MNPLATVAYQRFYMRYNIQGNIAIVTYTQTATNKQTGREGRSIRTDVWTRTDGKWLRLHFQYTPLTNDLVDMTNRFIEEVWNKGDLAGWQMDCVHQILLELNHQVQALLPMVLKNFS